ncbi:MAG: DUF882 domain-containing protein [Paracoccaceae bacterium]
MSAIDSIERPTRRALLGMFAGGAATLCAPAVLAGAGDYRRIAFVNNRTHERLDVVYWVEGTYVPEALDEISRILRDWRTEGLKPYDPRVIDVICETHRRLDCDEPFEIVSGYRSPETNAMLRRRSRGVARNSYHVKAMAVDLTLKSRSVRQIAGAAESLGAGGVGRYSRSEFVHMDSGPVRSWGR